MAQLVCYTVFFVDLDTDQSRYEPVWFPVRTTEKMALAAVKKQFAGLYYKPAGIQILNKVIKEV